MSLAIIHSRAAAGINAPSVTVEVHLSKGLPGFNIVGLPETAVKESKDRVRSAILNSGLEFPTAKIIVNLAPADLPKEGGRFDLPIALGILVASEQIKNSSIHEYEFAGELALTGDLRPIKGALPFAIATYHHHRKLILPLENAKEAALKQNIHLFPARFLIDVFRYFKNGETLKPFTLPLEHENKMTYPDLKDVFGQIHAKRCLEIAASGGHSLLMCGPPGTGKTMLASRLPGILPPMREEEALEVATIYSISRSGFDMNRWGLRPFRSPHHTTSAVALIGGGRPPQPGEVSLAHRGVLFLDELPEFNRHVLEVLREPLESGTVSISRASYQAQFPAQVQLIAAMNPCPCGYVGDASGRCRCTKEQIYRYQDRLSGPLLDRIDLHIQVPPVSKALFHSEEVRETSEVVRHRVVASRECQWHRAKKENAQLNPEEIKTFCHLEKKDIEFLEKTIEQLGLTARAYHRILKVARTIADLDHSEKIKKHHLQESLSYRKIKI